MIFNFNSFISLSNVSKILWVCTYKIGRFNIVGRLKLKSRIIKKCLISILDVKFRP